MANRCRLAAIICRFEGEIGRNEEIFRILSGRMLMSQVCCSGYVVGGDCFLVSDNDDAKPVYFSLATFYELLCVLSKLWFRHLI